VVRRALLLVITSLGCARDDWTYPTTDATTGAESAVDTAPAESAVDEAPADAAPADAAPADAGCSGASCGDACNAGFVRCAGACVAGPANLYRGDGDADDSAGLQHASPHDRVGFARGRFGDAFVIDGPSQYVTIPPEVGNFGAGDFTIAFWFSSTIGGVMLSKRAACWNAPPAVGEDFNLTAAGRVVVEVRTLDSFYTFFSQPGLNDGLWHFVALHRHEGLLTLDLDGAEAETMPVVGTFDDPSRTPTYLGVGRCVLGAPGGNGTFDTRTWFSGRIDEVAFYPRALTRAELAASARGSCGR